MKSLAWKMMLTALLTAGLVLALNARAHADDTSGGSTHVMEKPTRIMTVTVSGPLMIVGPIVEGQFEFKAGDEASIAVVGGGGQTVSRGPNRPDVKLEVWQLGGQARWFALGNFDKNLHLGAEVLYTDIQRGPGDDELGVFIHRRGTSIAPFVGVKYATEVGLSAEVQVGAAYEGLFSAADSRDTPDPRLAPMVNVNVGWSF